MTTAQHGNPTSEQTATSFFWVMTVQPAQRAAGGQTLATLSGTVNAHPGETRQQLFHKVRGYVADDLEQHGQPRGHNVLFYSLEPNQI